MATHGVPHARAPHLPISLLKEAHQSALAAVQQHSTSSTDPTTPSSSPLPSSLLPSLALACAALHELLRPRHSTAQSTHSTHDTVHSTAHSTREPVGLIETDSVFQQQQLKQVQGTEQGQPQQQSQQQQHAISSGHTLRQLCQAYGWAALLLSDVRNVLKEADTNAEDVCPSDESLEVQLLAQVSVCVFFIAAVF